MNKRIQQLAIIGGKSEKLIIGLMSGTSQDGVDLAICSIGESGMKTSLELKGYQQVRYPNYIAEDLEAISYQADGSIERLTLLHDELGRFWGWCVKQALERWGIDAEDVDAVASHGQTVFHAPVQLHQRANFGDATLQIGDADQLAHSTGIVTLHDFRQKHIAAGREGAPLSAYADRLLFHQAGSRRILLNIGGISNITYLDGSNAADEVQTTDCGPGNTLLDAVVKHQLAEQSFDRDGELAASGEVQETLLAAMLDHPFFERDVPKSTGQEAFNLKWVQRMQRETDAINLSLKDLLATLTELTVQGIKQSMDRLVDDSGYDVFVCGGGVHNKELMRRLQAALPEVKIKTTEALGVHPDAREAVLFAVLGNELLSGNGFMINGERVHLGKIALPG